MVKEIMIICVKDTFLVVVWTLFQDMHDLTGGMCLQFSQKVHAMITANIRCIRQLANCQQGTVQDKAECAMKAKCAQIHVMATWDSTQNLRNSGFNTKPKK
jgi:hypothetical protein